MAQSQPESLTISVMTEWPKEGRAEAVESFTCMLTALTERIQDPREVEQNIDRVFRSPISDLVTIQEEGQPPLSTATLNALPVLTGRGRRLWIDDVVTLPDYQGRGYSRRIMDTLEEMAAAKGDEVYLTSSVHRGPARRGYERRGYELLNEAKEPLVVFRNTTVGKTEPQPLLDAEILGPDFTAFDVEDLAALLSEHPAILEQNLDTAVNSPTTSVFVRRGTRGSISGVAVANETPIPVGKKPWIDNIAGVEKDDIDAVVLAAGTSLGSDYKHVNIVASPTADFEGYTIRNSGLYVKCLGGLATPNALA